MNRERWQDFNQVWETHQRSGSAISERWHKSADALSQMLLNASFLLNGGGVLAVPALHQFLYGSATASPAEADSAVIFFLGLVCTAISGIATIWNYRMIAANTEAAYTVSSKEIEEKWRAGGDFMPSEELKILQQTPLVGRRSIPLTFYIGWGFGLLSFVAFAIGGATLGGSHNPMCAGLGGYCLTR